MVEWKAINNKKDKKINLKKGNEMNELYPIDCTGDCCKGDEITWEHQEWERKQVNKFGKLAYVLGEKVWLEGVIKSESYGKDKMQHTFTIEMKNGKKLIKGRVLYRNKVLRKKWDDEKLREISINEKHNRRKKAMNIRKQEEDFIL